MASRTTIQDARVSKTEKNRRGSAVISLITGILSIFFLFLAFLMGEAGIAFLFIAFVLSAIGLMLGISARQSSKSRSLAVVGIIVTVIPFILSIIVVAITVFTIFLYF